MASFAPTLTTQKARTVYALLQTTARTVAHIDSAAGQGLHDTLTDFHGHTTPCNVRMDGIGGSDFITRQGTTYILLTAQGSTSPTHIGVAHNQLYAPNATDTTILSVSQTQLHPRNQCHVHSNDAPCVILDGVHFDLALHMGLFLLPWRSLPHLDCPTHGSLPRVVICPDGT